MRTRWGDIWLSLVMGLVVPGLVLNMGVMLLQRREPEQPETTAIEQTQPETVALTMRLRLGDRVTEMDLDSYLVGVLLAEMPMTFEQEALKAQAVAARTYTRKAYVSGGKHGDGSVCKDPGCCQAYLSEQEYLSQGGTEEGVEKARCAVLDTSGYVLYYEGELIEATYFSCSGGSTESAVAVWGTDYPYLQAVTSPGEEKAVHDRDTVTYTGGNFQKILGVALEGSPERWFREVTYTDGGGVETMTIGETVYRGTQLRSLLGLRSTAFSVQVSGNMITITTRGYGHRVGMSQYGADAMAVTGSDFRQILSHYYQGTELVRLEKDDAVSGRP